VRERAREGQVVEVADHRERPRRRRRERRDEQWRPRSGIAASSGIKMRRR
jgi:hypothetical protein